MQDSFRDNKVFIELTSITAYPYTAELELIQGEKDVALVQEDYPAVMGGIASGRIAAGALADPFADAAKKLGYKGVADIAAMAWNFPSSASLRKNLS